MPEPKDCMQRDDSMYDAMSTQELQQILREDVSKSEGEETDTATILYVMEVLARRRKEQNEGKSPAEALESFKREYDTQNDLISENRTRDRKMHTKLLWKRGLAAVIALAILVFGCSVTADAFGFDLWETIAKWTQETFHFGTPGETDPDKVPGAANSEVYAGLQSALDKANIHIQMPTWMPEGYAEVQVDVFETPKQRFVVALYQMNEQYIQIKITDYLGEDPERIEQSDMLEDVYSVNGTDYYLFNNVDSLRAVWIVDSYECLITGSMSMDEIKLMIDSID